MIYVNITWFARCEDVRNGKYIPKVTALFDKYLYTEMTAYIPLHKPISWLFICRILGRVIRSRQYGWCLDPMGCTNNTYVSYMVSVHLEWGAVSPLI